MTNKADLPSRTPPPTCARDNSKRARVPARVRGCVREDSMRLSMEKDVFRGGFSASGARVLTLPDGFRPANRSRQALGFGSAHPRLTFSLGPCTYRWGGFPHAHPPLPDGFPPPPPPLPGGRGWQGLARGRYNLVILARDDPARRREKKGKGRLRLAYPWDRTGSLRTSAEGPGRG